MPAHQAGAVSSSAFLRRDVILACVVNATMGMLYVWSLFLQPMETMLSVPRSSLSLAPGIGIVCFTIGMAVHDRVLRRLSPALYAIVAFALAGGGHLLFWLVPSFSALLIGYGVLFGLGAGLGYGLALALVTRVPDTVRSFAIGLVMAAFAVSGVVLSSVLAAPIQDADPARSFGLIGAVMVLLGLAVAGLLIGMPAFGGAPLAAGRESSNYLSQMLTTPFLRLALIFFLICYVGLMVISHATGILASAGLSAGLVGLAPAMFTGGYIIGSFGGGKLVDVLSGSRALLLANVVALIGVLVLLFPTGVFMLAGTLAVGAVFGSSASLMPVLIGEQYGVAQIGEVYGKLMISYGLAGLLAPWLSGLLYVWSGSYAVPLAVGVVVCLIGALLGGRIGSTAALPAGNQRL